MTEVKILIKGRPVEEETLKRLPPYHQRVIQVLCETLQNLNANVYLGVVDINDVVGLLHADVRVYSHDAEGYSEDGDLLVEAKIGGEFQVRHCLQNALTDMSNPNFVKGCARAMDLASKAVWNLHYGLENSGLF